jgi:hypothetical protein
LGSKGFAEDCKATSVRLEGGGDTHMHLAKGESGKTDRVVITTRLRGGVDDHVEISVPSISGTKGDNFDPSPEAGAAFRSVFGDDNSKSGDFNPSEEAGQAFRTVFGDDN